MDVAGGEGVGEAPGQFPFLIGIGRWPHLLRRAPRIECSSRSTQQTFDSDVAGIEHGRDLGGGEAENLAQHQGGRLPGRQVLQALDERQLHGLPRLVALVRSRSEIGDVVQQHIGIWLEPGRIFAAARFGRLEWRHRLGWEYPPATIANSVKTAVGGDPVQPCSQGSPSFIAG